MKTIIIFALSFFLNLAQAEDAIAIKVSPEKICKNIDNETEKMFCQEIEGKKLEDEDYIFLPSQIPNVKKAKKGLITNKSVDIGDDFVFDDNSAQYPNIARALDTSEYSPFYSDETAPQEIILLRKHFGHLTDGKTPNSIRRQTGHLFIIGVGFMGILLNLPPSIVRWDEDEKIDPGRLFSKYFDNLSHGPVIDNDDWAINYIGHPISGAWYYTMARQMGLSPAKSFLYSTMMSTFFWEFGIEAFAEKPSIQDLIITPVVGSLIGEVFWQLNQKIIANGYDRTVLGKVAQFLMNPAGMTGQGIHRLLQYLGANVEVSSTFKIVPRSNYVEYDGNRDSQNWYDDISLVFSLEFVF